MLYRVRIFKSMFGKSGVKNQWSNEYALELSDDLASAGIITAVNKLKAFEANFSLQDVYFCRAVVTKWHKSKIPRSPENYRVIQLDGRGTAGDPAVSATEPAAICLRIKFGSVLGGGGSKFYRGALAEDTVQASSDKGAQLSKPIFNFEANASSLLTSLGAGVLMTPNTKDEHGAPAQEVTQITIAGVSFHQTDRASKKKPIGSESGALDTIKEVGLGVAALAAWYFTKSPAALETAEVSAAPALSAAAERIKALLDLMRQGVG